MKKTNKRGFTLIELMIVLAIIAILAVVLVPKAGQMKDNARNAGVTTNVNAVRGTLEAKVVDTNYLGNFLATQSLLTKTFSVANSTNLTNPFNTKGVNVDPINNSNYFATTNVNSTGNPGTNSVVVCTPTPVGTVPAIATITSSLATLFKGNKGLVYVYVYSDGYAVFGVDSTDSAVNIAIIK